MYDAPVADLSKQSLETLISLAQTLPGVLYRCRNDADWSMDFISAGALELTGHPPGAFLEREVAYGDVIAEEHRDRVWAAVQAGVAARRMWRVEYRISRRDGEVRWVWEQGQGVFAADGALQFLAGYIVDIEVHKLAELELERRELELARKNALIEALGTPVLEVWDGTLVLPVIGELESGRGARLLEAALTQIVAQRARWLLLDVTGLTEISSSSADTLLQIARAIRLLGASCVITGVQPGVARALVELDVELGELQTTRSLKEGLALRLRAP